MFYFICLAFFTWKSYKNEIKFYIDVIAYLSLFPKKIIHILQKKGRKIDSHFLKLNDASFLFKKNSIKKTENTNNEIEHSQIKPSLYCVYLDLKSNLLNKKEISNLFAKNSKLNKSKKSRKNKIKEEENISKKYIEQIDNYQTLKKLTDEEI